jgi:hypothetical protein
MKKEYKYRMLIMLTLLFILFVGTFQRLSHISDENSVEAMSRLDESSLVESDQITSKATLSDNLLQVVKEPIRIGEGYYSIPDDYVAMLQSYIKDKSVNLTEKELYAFMDKFEEGKSFLQQLNSSSVDEFSEEDKTVLYFIAKSGLESIHLNLSYDPITGGIKVDDGNGATIYNTYSVKENFDWDFGFLVKVILLFVTGYVLYFIRIVLIRRKEVFNTNTRVYE